MRALRSLNRIIIGGGGGGGGGGAGCSYQYSRDVEDCQTLSFPGHSLPL